MRHNPCLANLSVGNLDTTVIAEDGTTTVQRFRAAGNPSFDCFYVYPTVSTARSRNAPKRPAPELVIVARAQAALFQRHCRLFVPVYRQITRRGLLTGGFSDPEARALAQADVVDAFHDYLNRYSHGRRFLLLGHSQGATALISLIQSDIDGDPELRSRLVSAMLLGGSPFLSSGSTTQGSFRNVPPCRSRSHTGCVVAYNTYSGPPPADALFGRANDRTSVICVNPAAPEGGAALLDPIVPAAAAGIVSATGFVQYRDAVRARCRATARFSWLDARLPPGSQLAVATAELPADWGLHRVDVTIALGDLIALAAAQAAAMH